MLIASGRVARLLILMSYKVDLFKTFVMRCYFMVLSNFVEKFNARAPVSQWRCGRTDGRTDICPVFYSETICEGGSRSFR